MAYVLNKSLRMKKRSDPNLYALGQPCTHKCRDVCVNKGCKACKIVKEECEICPKNKPYELLETGMIGGPRTVFCQYAEAGKSKIRSHIYKDPTMCKAIVGYDVNSLYLYCSGQKMPCGKERIC